MANLKLDRWPWEEQQQQAGPYDFPIGPSAEPTPSAARRLGDVATQFAAGVPYAARGVVGLAGLIPGVNYIADPLAEGLGQAGQFIEESLLSDYAKQQRQELAARTAAEEGFLDQAGATLRYLGENPSMIPGVVAQSIPSIYSGGLIGATVRRGAQAAGLTRAGTMAPVTTAAVGEGAMIAGSTAAEIASQNPEEFAARYYGIPAGVGGAAVSLASGRLLGRSDIDTMLAQRLTRGQLAAGEAQDMLTFTPGMVGRVGRGVLGEGILEEAPQSAMEQIATNLGTNRPAFEDLGREVAMGAVTGAAMGAGGGLFRPSGTYTRQELAQAQQIAADETLEPRVRLEALDFIRRAEISQYGPEEAQARFAEQTVTPYEQPAFSPYEQAPFTPYSPPLDVLSQQGVQRVETGEEVAPGIIRTADGLYMMTQPQDTGGVTGGLGPMRQAALLGPQGGVTRPPAPAPVTGGLGPMRQAALFGPGPRPVVGDLGPMQQAALTGTQPRPVAGALGPLQQAALAGPAQVPSSGAAAASLPATTVAGLSTPKTPPKSKGVVESAAKVEPLSAAEIDEVGRILGDLEAKVASEPGQAGGRVTLPQGVLAGVMRTIRSLKNLTPVVFQPKSGKVDVEQTNQYADQMNSIRDAAKDVVAKAEALFNAQSNVIPSESKANLKVPRGMTADQVAEQKAQDAANKLIPLQQALRNSIENLRAVAGSDRNVEALVAVLKARVQKPGTKMLDQAKRDTKVDTLLSQSWALYKDGALDSAEGLDIVRSRATRLSKEREAVGAEEQPLVGAATEGYSRRVLRQKKGETSEQYEARVEASKEKGVLGMLAYIQRHGTGFERLLAASVARALRNPNLTQPKLEWIPLNETPRYDPKTNTVYVHRTASPEQSLHETLHAGLQWFVYQNPNLAEVLRLDRALQKVLDYTGPMSPKAKEVIDVLRKVAKGRSKTARLDAILELISYGSTLNEFRQLLKTMETAESKDQQGLLSGLTDLWKRITALVQKFLGVNNTVANDVLDATIALLEQASTADQVGKRTGNILQLIDATTAAFKRWFGNSKIVDASGKPLVLYHGTSKDFDTFEPGKRGAIFLSADPEFASMYAEGEDGKVLPVFVKAENPFDYENPEHVRRVMELSRFPTNVDRQNVQDNIELGNWNFIEDRSVQKAIKDAGFDGFYIKEMGVKNLAVYQSTQLKSATGNQGTFDPASGNILEAAVSGGPNVDDTTAKVVKEAGYPSFLAWANSPGGSFNPTRLFLETLGFGKAGYTTNKIRAAGKKAAAKIRKDFPTLERVILAIDSQFSNPPTLQKIVELFKSKQNTGILEMEKISEYLQRNQGDAEAVLNYLDGDTKALDGIKHSSSLKAIADNVIRHLNMYIEDLPAGSKERKLFESLKFSEYLLNPESVAQLAGKSFGMKKLSTLLGVQRRAEASIDDFKDLLPKDSNGNVNLDAPLYQVFETKMNPQTGKQDRMPWGFIGKEMADKNPPAGLDIEFGRVWRVEKFSDEGYSFVSRTTTPAAVREMARKQEIDKLSAALLNTMAALSHNYASRYYLNGLAATGREDGKATPSTVAFNNVEEINEVFKDRVLTDDNVLKVSDDAAKMQSIRSVTQRTGTWVQLPDTETYGELAGKIIPGPVWNSMLDMHDRSPLFNWQALNTTMGWFKKTKTVYTPATHVNNILTNYALMLLHGISNKTLKDAAVLFARFETNPDSLPAEQRQMMQAFYASGAVLGQFTTTEAKQTIAKALADNLSPDSNRSFITSLGDMAKFEKRFAQLIRVAKNADARATEFYAAGDNIFRLAAFMNTAGNIQLRDKSTTLNQDQLEEAGIAARKLFLDYDIDSRFVRAARQSFLPFISWSYAIMPVLGRIAIEKPWAIVNMMAAIAVMSAVMGGDDDEEIRREGPDQLREKTFGVPHYIRIPFMGDADNPVYYNIGKSIPMMSLFQPSPQQTKLFGQEWVPGFLNPNGPYISLLGGVMFNIDPFTGKPFTQPTDTQWEKFVATGESVYNTMAPIPFQTKFVDQVQGLAEERIGPTGEGMNALFLARTLGGLSLYKFNRDESRFFQAQEVKKIKKDFNTAMNRAKREEYRKGYPDYESLDKDLAELRSRMDKAIKDIYGTDNEDDTF